MQPFHVFFPNFKKMNRKKKCWKICRNLSVVLAGTAAITNVAFGVYIYYNVDVNGVINRINDALDAYGDFLPVAENTIAELTNIITTMNTSLFRLLEKSGKPDI
jgi:hypothetical protein